MSGDSTSGETLALERPRELDVSVLLLCWVSVQNTNRILDNPALYLQM